MLRTRAFLVELSRSSVDAMPRDVVSVAGNLLRHYPSLADIELTCATYPTCWEMPVMRPKPGR
ncbi:hypothetical protein WT06_07045 [Burkholderia anthina]|nr:hypothetical protein WT06_07045 [Burkholderia anthina]